MLLKETWNSSLKLISAQKLANLESKQYGHLRVCPGEFLGLSLILQDVHKSHLFFCYNPQSPTPSHSLILTSRVTGRAGGRQEFLSHSSTLLKQSFISLCSHKMSNTTQLPLITANICSPLMDRSHFHLCSFFIFSVSFNSKFYAVSLLFVCHTLSINLVNGAIL